MPRPIRAQPYNPNKPHDRRASDLLRNADVAPIIVDDPMGLDPGDKIVTLRSIRCDPLAAMHSKKLISEEQYHGGRAYQDDWEAAERGPQAIDPSKEKVDGGKPAEPLTDHQRDAVVRLGRADQRLGESGTAIIRDFLIAGLSMQQICRRRELDGVREKLYIGRRVKECLADLAFIYGIGERPRRPRIDWKPSIYVPGVGLVYLTEDDVRQIIEQNAQEKQRARTTGERI